MASHSTGLRSDPIHLCRQRAAVFRQRWNSGRHETASENPAILFTRSHLDPVCRALRGTFRTSHSRRPVPMAAPTTTIELLDQVVALGLCDSAKLTGTFPADNPLPESPADMVGQLVRYGV